MTTGQEPCPAIFIDCDALNYLLLHMGLREPVEEWLRLMEAPLRTLDTIYRQEMQDALRQVVDDLHQRNLFSRVDAPSRRVLARSEAKVAKKVERRAAHSTTSANDRDLLVQAILERGYIVTGDGPLITLAGLFGNATCLSILDAVDAISRARLIDEDERARAFEAYPITPEPASKREHFEQRSRERGGPRRAAFDCVDDFVPEPEGSSATDGNMIVELDE